MHSGQPTPKVADLIADLRARGVTTEEIAHATGCSPSQVRKISRPNHKYTVKAEVGARIAELHRRVIRPRKIAGPPLNGKLGNFRPS
ncbi:hypothetical protein GOC53_14865 [Sinorhizobium medicae]|uniref:hypothetical protein n=1 Tax=Rhizobium meliloti TaxID=382 RepID=UPI000B4A31EB|nr:hypothetical protein [Sinorhizobium meliloti]ASP51467.1 hypothetical protein CDO31_07720 [Sinorhizobium meliloti]MDX0491543.1 hypothetical protein [Sinorhizobium medicae]